MENATRKGMIADEELKQGIDEFIGKVLIMKFGDDTPASRRTAEEIAWVNQFIDKVLEQTGYANVLIDLNFLDPKKK